MGLDLQGQGRVELSDKETHTLDHWLHSGSLGLLVTHQENESGSTHSRCKWSARRILPGPVSFPMGASAPCCCHRDTAGQVPE